MGERALPFLAVGRVRDGVSLAYYSAQNSDEQAEQTKDIFRKLLGAASSKLENGQRTRLQWNDGSVCCLMDDQGALLYCLVTSLLAYPERLAYQLLYDFRVVVSQIPDLDTVGEHSLNDKLQSTMLQLVQQYEDPKNFPGPSAPGDGSNGVDRPPNISRGNALVRDPRMLRLLVVVGAVLLLILLIVIVKAMSS
mmetsp:Transcript_22850/g.51902  ORF Transcript_22850/g.51902 Transcript_22850/m.51902 type:complete len:194 (-) Transcript_22850:155-736(-)